MQGFIYIFTNESMPGIVKVGRTNRLPADRAAELFTTGVPTPFAVALAIQVPDVDAMEREVHEELEPERVTDLREFFRLDEEDAIERVLNVYLSSYHEMLTVGCTEMWLDDGNVHRYADICGEHPFSVSLIINEITPEGWKTAAAAYRDKCNKRRAAIEQRKTEAEATNGEAKQRESTRI